MHHQPCMVSPTLLTGRILQCGSEWPGANRATHGILTPVTGTSAVYSLHSGPGSGWVAKAAHLTRAKKSRYTERIFYGNSKDGMDGRVARLTLVGRDGRLKNDALRK